jgi:hypothetical protein
VITLADYWMGRDKTHAAELTQKIQDNAAELVGRINLLLSWAAIDGVFPGIDSVTGTAVASGWRPAGVNARTKNAATGSKHLLALGGDLQDVAGRALARWCLRNLDALEEAGLWMEDPQWTPDWVHLQSVPPGSGRRVYVPSQNPPLVAKLPEQENTA